MTIDLNLFYARDTSDKDVKKFCKLHDIELSVHPAGYPMMFLEFEHTRGEELSVVLDLCECKENVTVYLMQLNHLGQGAKSKQIQKRIEQSGSKIIVPEKKLEKRGPKPKHGLTQEQIEEYRLDFDKGVLSQQAIIDKILRDTGNKLTRYQLANLYNKPKK
jgi:hypothetical protein